jgi:hypothetical protein
MMLEGVFGILIVKFRDLLSAWIISRRTAEKDKNILMSWGET